jgi:hypothetical protein
MVDPKRKTVALHRRHSASLTLGLDDEIDASDVVPGFTCLVSRLFE